MKDESITFAQLRAKLVEFGFEQYRVKANGKQGYLFERENEPSARIYLADYSDNEQIHPFDLRTVLMTLRSRGIIEEANPLVP